MTAAMFAQVAQILELAIEIGEQALDARHEIRADLAELKLSRGAIEQPHAQAILELAHRLADGGLRHPERTRRGAEAAGLDDADEGAELFQVELIYQHSL
jgi:hypothetical protein